MIEYAENDVSRQVSQIQELTAEEVSAFVIAPVDPYGLKSVLESVKEAEIPVFSYDDLIMDTNAVKYYVTFGGRQIGQMIGKKIIESWTRSVRQKNPGRSNFLWDLWMIRRRCFCITV